MFLTITTTRRPATDLGLLLGADPGRVLRWVRPYGNVHVFFPESTPDRCTAALLLDVDSPRPTARADAGPARRSGRHPHTVSSLLATALGDVFHAALEGRCADAPDLARERLPLVVSLPAVSCHGDPTEPRRLFEPLGWRAETAPLPLDPGLPGWGDSHHASLTLTGEQRLADALGHLRLLLPVLDPVEGHGMTDDLVEPLLRAQAGRLAAHPDRDLIIGRYLDRRGRSRTAMTPGPSGADPAATGLAAGLRALAVVAALRAEGATSVIDLCCGQGELLGRLLADPAFERVAGTDSRAGNVGTAARLLGVDPASGHGRGRLELFTGSPFYRDPRFLGYDAAVLSGVGHVLPSRLAALEHVVFGHAAPRVVVVLPQGGPGDHRNPVATGVRSPGRATGWFRDWAGGVAARRGYRLRLAPAGFEGPDTARTEMGVFTR
ncbi:3' terminal RNA ribose 2'-O-methyltransferase Hen1 [Marinactinospora thermotolerans DSM 45154]|uniref:Small RNA 2'-O-methyltransferase n=1 Tax=Marinactinospora thermotolerans DSM 45154 TaxID=1122192 RepID=A0A1T4TF93_9ACTN|nr:hypothetical protein [Marinactinospora thermotolerans]SKA39127.1 3' terminal RNA ribose 2'-O-methyltransferase Hen1 [Marinactinospora thermotolerans DSM 45154]